MNAETFLDAIRDEPEADLHRLALADWLEENGQPARAGWIRASCQEARTGRRDPTLVEVFRRQRECWERCRPEWWEEITGVHQNNDRGTFHFQINSKTAAGRLGKVKWLGDAAAGGWLAGITIRWSDGEVAAAVGKWKGAVREIPLFVRPAPQITDEGLAIYHAAPRLRGLYLPGVAARILHLGPRTDLRELELDWLSEERVFDRVGKLVGLRRLEIQGRQRPRPTDEDLVCLRGLSELRELQLVDCRALTGACLSRLTGLGALRLLQLWGCRGVPEEAVAALRQAMPAVQVERV
jgi:uncharacterized protein (TIGR02996 family)